MCDSIGCEDTAKHTRYIKQRLCDLCVISRGEKMFGNDLKSLFCRLIIYIIITLIIVTVLCLIIAGSSELYFLIVAWL